MKRLDHFLLFTILLLAVQACSPGAASGPASSLTLPPPAATATPVPSASPLPDTPLPPATTSPTATSSASIPPTGPLSRAALVDALRGGGYIIYFRHAATTPIPDDASPVVLDDCTTQRNLSPTGQAQARQVGENFRRLGIPVGKVLSSPFCRALDTARLAFDRAEIEPLLETWKPPPVMLSAIHASPGCAACSPPRPTPAQIPSSPLTALTSVPPLM